MFCRMENEWACGMDDGSCGFAWFVLGSGRAPRMLLPRRARSGIFIGDDLLAWTSGIMIPFGSGGRALRGDRERVLLGSTWASKV